MTTSPKVDYKKLATLGNYKTAASANTCWCTLRKKIELGVTETTAAAGASVAGPAGGKKRKAAVKDDDEETPAAEIEEEGEKKPKAKKAKKAIKWGRDVFAAEAGGGIKEETSADNGADDSAAVKPEPTEETAEGTWSSGFLEGIQDYV